MSKKSLQTNYHDTPELWKGLLTQGLKDDHWQLDWTALGTLSQSHHQTVQASIVAKAPGIWAAAGARGVLEQLAGEMGGTLNVQATEESGKRVRKGEVVMRWSGTPRELLALERPFLNLASYSGGIATRTRRLVDKVREACPENPPRVTATRKILPGYRDLAILAVQIGGGFSHRVDLSGGVLIKENHIAAAGTIERAITGARSVAPHGLRIECEVRSIAEMEQAIRAGADAVLLDNFSPDEVSEAVKNVGKSRSRSKPLIEVSGGLTEDNISDYAIPGVDILSVGSLTHSVTALDLSLLVEGL